MRNKSSIMTGALVGAFCVIQVVEALDAGAAYILTNFGLKK